MDSDHVAELTSKLSEDISALREALEPLTKESLNETASNLPVLDRAKLYTVAAYSLESILFSNLRLQGVDARSHPIFTELARVRQYFDKIKAAETGEAKPSLRLNKAAVSRIIKHDLAGNNSLPQGQGTKRKFTDNDAAGGGGVKETAASSANPTTDDNSTAPATPVARGEGTGDGAGAGAGELQEDFMVIDEEKKKKGKKKNKKNRKSAGAQG